MKVEVRVTANFRREAKSLIKRYRSFLEDLEDLQERLLKNPKLGTPLGKNVYKIRLKIQSKGKGKSGGARVISYVEQEILAAVEDSDEKTVVNLLSVYDKSDKATLSDKELKKLIENIEI